MTGPKQTPLSREEVLSLRGLRLPAVALKELRRAGVYCQPAISIEFQQSAQRYVLRGVESGGAVARIGAYSGFVDESGVPLATIQAVNTIGVNGLHVAVLSPVFVRLQMFRTGTTCELLITHHALSPVEGKIRPRLRSSVLFHGRRGRLEMELWAKDRHLSGIVGPVFYSRSGEQLTAPDRYHDAILRVTAGACCVGCRHTHVAKLNHSSINSCTVLPGQEAEMKSLCRTT